MKKIYLLIIITLTILVFTCTVNQNTGLIVLSNLTNEDISNVKIGSTTLTCYLSRGAKVDYWYYTPLTGKLTGGGVVSNRYFYNLNDNEGTQSADEDSLEFKLNYEYKIDVIHKDDKNYFYIHGGVQPGEDYDDDEGENPLD
jgi:hypothetical protein